MYDRDFEDDEPSVSPSKQMERFPIPRAPSVASTSSSSHHHHLNNYQRAGPSSSSSLQLPPSSPGFRPRAASPSHRMATSPTVSMFSTSSSHTPSHLALRYTVSQASSARPLLPTPASPPRPRRRLRKKSRPQEVGSEVFEMQLPQRARQIGSMIDYGYLEEQGPEETLFDEMDEDRALEAQKKQQLPSSLSLPTTRPHSPTTIPPSRSVPHPTPSSPPSSPPTKTPLLSRIGSVKRWRTRRSSNASGGDKSSGNITADISADSSFTSNGSGGVPYVPPKTPEPSFSRSATPASPPSASKHYWLFRGSPGSKSSTNSGSPPNPPDLGRANSKGRGDRPLSRFGGRKRSTTVDEVLVEEDTDLPAALKGKGKDVSDVDRTPRTSLGTRRPLSLQPQPSSASSRPNAAKSAINWAAASMGRSSVNPFVASGGSTGTGSGTDEGVSLEPLRKRMPVSNMLKKRASASSGMHHKRSISLASDPDEASFTHTPLASPSLMETPPPVPRIPQSVLSAGSASASSSSASIFLPGVVPTGSSISLAPPIELSPPSPPRVSALQPDETPRRANHPRTLSASHSVPVKSLVPSGSTPPLPTDLLSSRNGMAPSSPGQSVSLGRATTQDHVAKIHPLIAPGVQQPASHMRRNSLGDLKIPARISMAQTGLRNNLGMVREFANKVDGA